MEKRQGLPLLAGIAIGYGVAVGFWPGGYDAKTFYLRPFFQHTTAPGWVYFLTLPLSWLGWPLGWQVLVVLSVLVVGSTALRYGNKRWWMVFLSTPFLWDVWLGQIELFPAMGFLLTLLVVMNKASPIWLGLSWLALLTKPQTGMGLLVFHLLWWLKQERTQRVKILRAPVLSFLLGGLVSVLVWPQWPSAWLATMVKFRPTWWNAAIWPYGLLVWPVSIYWARMPSFGLRRQMRLFAAASLLGSPYFALYHCTTLMAVTDDVWALVLSWLIVGLGKGVPAEWMKWGWLLPLWVWWRTGAWGNIPRFRLGQESG